MLIESKNLKLQLQELITRNVEEIENAKYSQRLHNLVGENAAYWEVIKYLEKLEVS